jgi:A/G-specific adenine glycosylase
VDRVIARYTEFIRIFPDVFVLAKAPKNVLLGSWQGLGYNRRALMLQTCARIVVEKYGGKIPADAVLLQNLPGIGVATSGSLCAFAFNQPIVFIETNVRSVFIHEFFRQKSRVSDEELVPFIEQTMDRKNPRRWYSALMDYGSHLKKTISNPSRKSSRFAVQPKFQGSDRQVRGKILRMLLTQGKAGLKEMELQVQINPRRLHTIVAALTAEGFIRRGNRQYCIAK